MVKVASAMCDGYACFRAIPSFPYMNNQQVMLVVGIDLPGTGPLSNGAGRIFDNNVEFTRR